MALNAAHSLTYNLFKTALSHWNVQKEWVLCNHNNTSYLEYSKKRENFFKKWAIVKWNSIEKCQNTEMRVRGCLCFTETKETFNCISNVHWPHSKVVVLLKKIQNVEKEEAAERGRVRGKKMNLNCWNSEKINVFTYIFIWIYSLQAANTFSSLIGGYN